MATFGGGQSNFQYARYCLDFCFFRAYEGGQPAVTADCLKLANQPVKAGQLVFMAGHPGHSEGRDTYEHLLHLKTVTIPYRLRLLRSRRQALERCFLRANPEALSELEGLENSLTVQEGQLGTARDSTASSPTLRRRPAVSAWPRWLSSRS